MGHHRCLYYYLNDASFHPGAYPAGIWPRRILNMWQDIVLAGGSWLFLVALLPTIFSRTEKPTLSTSVLTALVVSVFAYTYYTLALWNATFGAIALSIGWWILAYQRWQLNRKESIEETGTHAY